MKHYLSSLLCLLLLFAPVSSAFADKQPGQQKAKKEQKEAQRQQHLVEVLQLNITDAKHFTDLYTEYSKEMRDARKKYARIRPKDKGSRLTEEQIRQNLDRQYSMASAILDIRQKYHQEYLKFLPPSKVERLYNLEKKSAEQLRSMAEKRHKGKKK